MLCNLGTCVNIRNRRLDGVFLSLWLGTFSLCVHDFINDKKYTAKILTTTVAQIVAGLPDTVPSDASMDRWCKIAATPVSSYTCREFCKMAKVFNTTNYTSCMYAEETILQKGYDEVQMVLSKHSMHLGPQVKKTSGFPLWLHYEIHRVAATPFDIRYTSKLTAPIPEFIAGLNAAIQMLYTERTAATVVLDRQGKIWKKFEAAARVTMTAAELMWLAKPQVSDHDLLRQVEAKAKLLIGLNVTAETLYGTSNILPFWVFHIGADLGGQVRCFNDNHQIRSVIPDAQDLGIGLDKPICVLSWVLYTPAMMIQIDNKKEIGKHIVSTSLGLRFKVSGHPGQFLVWDYAVILQSLVSTLVLLRIPSQVIRVFALNCLGHLSAIYRRVTVHNFHLREQCSAAALKLVQSASSFKQLADVQLFDGGEAISRKKLCTIISEALQCMPNVLDENEISQLSGFCLERLTQSSSPEHLVRGKEYHQACLLSEDIDLVSMTRLFDKSRRRRPGERLFAPSMQVETKNWHMQGCIQNSACFDHFVAVSSHSGASQPSVVTQSWKQNADDSLKMLSEELGSVQRQLCIVMSKLGSVEAGIENLESWKSRHIRENAGSENVESPINVLRSLGDAHQAEDDKVTSKSTAEIDQKLIEFEIRLQASIQKAVAAAFSVAQKKIYTLSESLSSAMIDLDDSRMNMERHTASLNLLIDDRLGYLEQQVRVISHERNTDFEIETKQGPQVESNIKATRAPEVCSASSEERQFEHLWRTEFT